MLKLTGASKLYKGGVCALDGIDLYVPEGAYVSISGASGSGKSTLLHVLGLLDTLTAGTYQLDGENVSVLPRRRLAELRGQKIGFIFQRFQLISHMDALENVALPLIFQSVPRAERCERAAAALAAVGLSHRQTHRPDQLSGGQQQRVAIARALVTRPRVLLADEPTAGLDPDSSADILTLLDRLHERGNTIVLITHDPAAAAHAQTRCHLENGKLSKMGG